ncbi:MAG: DUF58 domain-containing protein [Bacteroidales bacterium]|nr:DUF58 domain-containing protein [Bacteroidales bacterium]
MENNASDLIKKVRKIEIRTKALSQQLFAGQYHSAFKGRGMTFSEVREYQYGDDVRSIDWNVTARFHRPYVKVFEEERELTVMLLVDVSSSHAFGTRGMYKKDLVAEIAAVLAFSALSNNDKVGVLFFSDKVEKFIPPQKGSSHILRIIRELVAPQPEGQRTNIAEALRYLTNVLKKRCTAFVLSDFMDTGFEDALRIARNKHEVVALQLLDKGELNLPALGMLRIRDAETGRVSLVDTSSSGFTETYARFVERRLAEQQAVFQKSGTAHVRIFTDEDYIPALKRLFSQRR